MTGPAPTQQVAKLKQATGGEQVELAVSLLERSHDLEVLRAALAVITAQEDASLRPVLHRKYAWCEEQPTRRDMSGFVRARIVRALQPIVHPDDRPLLLRALATYQMQGMYELCAELRTAALLAMDVLDTSLSELFAARFLADPLTSFSGEPALTAIRLLAAHQRLEPIFAYASWPAKNGEVVGEALRNLTELPRELVDLLIEAHWEAKNVHITLGLFDLLLGHVERERWHDRLLSFVATGRDMDVYGIVVTSIVASRDDGLIAALRHLAAEEPEGERRRLLEHALELG